MRGVPGTGALMLEGPRALGVTGPSAVRGTMHGALGVPGTSTLWRQGPVH
jgi:hypothetical protein